MDGVFVAVGWCGGDGDPQIVWADGSPMKQTLTRYDRPDLATQVKDVDTKAAGFRIAAHLDRDQFSNDEVYVEFSDGTRLQKANRHPEDKINELMTDFVDLVNENPSASMIEIGSRARSGKTYKQLFPETIDYIGMDVADGPNVDLVGDAHRLSLLTDKKFDFAFSVSVFEHLVMPWVAAYELNKILKVGGLAYIQSHPSWPLHERPWDFFRFSTDAYAGLFNPLTGFTVVRAEYGIESAAIPRSMGGDALQNIEAETSFLLSACLVRKTGAPEVDWTTDPSKIYDLGYSH